MHAPIIRTPIYIKQMLTDLKREVDNNTIIIEKFHSSLSTMDRYSRHKNSKETLDLSYTLDQIDLRDIYRTFHLSAAEHTFFSSAHKTFSRIDHMLGHKTSFSKFKIEIIPSIFSNHNGMKL